MKRTLKLKVAAVALAVTGGFGAMHDAAAQSSNEIFIPALVYRTGPYAPNGVPFANGYVDYLKLVNATSTPQPIEAAISGATPGSSATVYTLSGKNTAETNSIDDPKRIVPVRSTIKTGAKFSHTVPPYAIQVIVIGAL